MLKRALLLAILAALPLCAKTETTVATPPYYIAFLRPDPARKPLAKSDAELIQSAHMANIRKMANDGVLVSAGPFDDTPTTISGIFVFKVDSLLSAQAIALQDPTVRAHRNTIDVHAWYGPPGIGVEYFRLHKLDPKTPENMQVHPFCMIYRGSAWDEKAQSRDSILLAHEQYIHHLKDQGKLGAAGRITDSGDLIGIVIFKPLSLDESQTLLQQDPAVQAGILRVEYHHWWSSDHVLPW